jgi:glutaredoxin
MKFYLNIFALLITTSIYSQSNDIELLDRNEDGIVYIDAKNNSDNDIEVKLTLTFSGMSADKESPITELVPKNSTKQLAALTMTGGPASYNTSLSYSIKTTASANRSDMNTTPIITNTDLVIPQQGILVFSKNGCGRCTFAHNHLTNNNIKFKEINISENDENSQFFWKTLKESGFTGNSVQTPVIVVDGKVHTKIKDLKGFLNSISEN